MTQLVLEASTRPPVSEASFEVVERKGLGHPDTICDAIMDEAARAVARAHVETFGAPKHFNLDKSLLAAGSSEPRFGGGSVREPMKLVFGDRAVYVADGREVPVGDVVVETAKRWFRERLRFVDPESHLAFQNEIRAGSAELIGIFSGESPKANDTSAAYAFAPWSTTERLTLETERFLNGAELKERHPEVGEDVKVMAVRREGALSLTVAIAFVDRFVDSERRYFELKEQTAAELREHLTPMLGELSDLELAINTLDAPGGGADSVYLTVTGTSAEAGDSGQVGRGNWLSGFFSARRPSSNEAAAGKNPQSHVGKIYNHLAQRIADRIAGLEPVKEAGVHLVSRIGAPLPEPHFTAVELSLVEGAGAPDVRSDVEAVTEAVLKDANRFAEEWLAAST